MATLTEQKLATTKQPTDIDYGTFYTRYYKTEDDDSPPGSRRSLVRRMHRVAALSPVQLIGIDVGAGKQILEKDYWEYLKCKKLTPNIWMHTLDIAEIDQKDLLADPSWTFHHIADCRDLTREFSSQTFDIAISNMALDFVGEQGVRELRRVLKPTAPVLLNLHHPIPLFKDLDGRITRAQKRMGIQRRFGSNIRNCLELEMDTLKHHSSLRDRKVLFESANEAGDFFEGEGFIVYRAEEGRRFNERWWEVDMQKPADPHAPKTLIYGNGINSKDPARTPFPGCVKS